MLIVYAHSMFSNKSQKSNERQKYAIKIVGYIGFSKICLATEIVLSYFVMYFLCFTSNYFTTVVD